ncbi:hypothetical protein PspLS_01801 [Pyricularia sp. CBS 133598]|nr:hypothetical protein PspLS_01801 [Pyricularia sp. CBS 133598]
MDPITISTAAITFAGAVGSIYKGIHKLKSLGRIDADVCDLLNELETLHLFAKQASRTVDDLSRSSDVLASSMQALERIRSDLCKTAAELDVLATDLALASNGRVDKQGQARISKLKWQQNKKNVTKLREQCCRSRNDIALLLNMLQPSLLM